jgi:hypothetical protein
MAKKMSALINTKMLQKGHSMHGPMKPTSFLLLALAFVWLTTLAGPTKVDDKAKEEEAPSWGSKRTSTVTRWSRWR